MTPSIPVEHILHRAPERARAAYTNLVAHPQSFFDGMTGWSCTLIQQKDLADEMGCSLRTTERALADLRELGLARVLAWPHARTETQVRVTDVTLSSVFGPVREFQERMNAEQLVDEAVRMLLAEWRSFEEEMRME